MNTKLFLGYIICFGGIGVHGIVSTGSSNKVTGKNVATKNDNTGSETINRDYNIAAFDDAYGHEGYGLSAHAGYGIPEGHGYDVHEANNFHVHHVDSYHHHHPDHHKHHDYNYHKALALKGLLVPLAGVALLGAAAAFVSNPILLQLGVISGSSLGRRKRDTNKLTQINEKMSEEDRIRLKEIKLLEKFMAKPGRPDFAYTKIYHGVSSLMRPKRQIPQEDIKLQNKRLFADYLSCSGITSENACLERMACELHSPEGASMPMEANVMSIVVNEILHNDFITEGVKTSLSKAIQQGKKNLGCRFYRCDDMEKYMAL